MYKMNLTKYFAAILLLEFLFASEPFASCDRLSETIKETKLLLSYSGWKDILDHVKTKTAEGEFGDGDVAKLVDKNVDIKRRDILDLVKHIFLMLNCRYASRLLFLSTIIKDVATKCGYFAYPDEIPFFSMLPLYYCEEVLYAAFELALMDLSFVYSALKYFQTMSPRSLDRKSLRPINRSFKWNCEQLLSFYRLPESPATIRTQLQSTVSALQMFNEKLLEYFNHNCREETGYPELTTAYRTGLDDLIKDEPDKIFDYFQKKIVEVTDDITKNNFWDCGFLYNSGTKTCTLKQPETSTSQPC